VDGDPGRRVSAAPPGGAVARLAARLAAAGCVAADDEATELLAAAPDAGTLERWARRREGGEPLAWIVGSTSFGGRRIRVDRGVYVPRPMSAEVARRAAATLPAGGRAVDLCTGSGAVAALLLASVPGVRVVGIDVDPLAATCARSNGVAAVVGDLDAPLRVAPEVDAVTAVPPYVPTPGLRLLPADVQRHEPRRALDGGPDGLDLARRVVGAAARLLRLGGWLVLELGGDQDAALAAHLADAGFEPPETWRDEDGDLRGLTARLAR
jgi:release factor glutamine methyltransferase